MCALADAQIASPIAFERGCSVQRCYGSLRSARSLARQEGWVGGGVGGSGGAHCRIFCMFW